MALETFEKLSEEKKERILSAGIREFSRKSYTEARTENITKECRISKGILFHYFGSKKAFYLYCLEICLQRLTEGDRKIEENGFYECLFQFMHQKMSRCKHMKDETYMVNMASREGAEEISESRDEVFRKYGTAIHAESVNILNIALSGLKLRNDVNREYIADGLMLYVNALISRYLAKYQTNPDRFFAGEAEIRSEMKEYLDLMLHGICTEEET